MIADSADSRVQKPSGFKICPHLAGDEFTSTAGLRHGKLVYDGPQTATHRPFQFQRQTAEDAGRENFFQCSPPLRASVRRSCQAASDSRQPLQNSKSAAEIFRSNFFNRGGRDYPSGPRGIARRITR